MPEGGGPVHYYLGVDWADQTHAVWVVDERGTKITTRTVPGCPSPKPRPVAKAIDLRP